ncbi:Uncharacterised protein [BD1-7 clade bacterium]|uniref:TonB C-terminal domain-containing protein n=1 Tax=BD1-7 clade bacterium TaxID=2029982 RepID=A0A5S9MV09_9GAMM|nr:Uncharacterised protein [BD1-7 clade bacterium]CAA0080865.1 Uncharacterised protein [BD1-7 clade bacterium]CAA0084501.1 Uncharacterised protein [BD1-7 clade bacterium]
MQYLRLIIGACLAAVVTVGLLMLMERLIHSEYEPLEDQGSRKIADISMGETDIETQTQDRKPDKPDEAEEPPPELEQMDMQDSAVDTEGVNVTPTMKADLSFGGGPGLSSADGEYLPMVKVQPQYPRRAQSRGIEGYCVVEYTVTKTGSTRDPVAIDCVPKGIFERTSVKAVSKFKYKPRVENGEPIEVQGVQNKFKYKLAD